MLAYIWKKLNPNLILSIGSLILLIFTLRYITQFNVPVVIHDEFGYWANAAFFAGKDWSGVSSLSPYYSYGYSLILTPLFYIFKNPTMMYKVAIILNMLFNILALFISYRCICLLLKKDECKFIAFSCLITSLYGSTLLNIFITWCEPLLYLMYWISIYFIINLKKRNVKYYIGYAIVLTSMYIIHQRTIGIFICGISIIWLLAILKYTDRECIIFFTITIILCLFIHILIKRNITDALWNNYITNYVENANNYQGQLNKIIDLTKNFKGIFKVIRGFFSRYFYLIISTGSVIFYGFLQIIRKMLKLHWKISNIYVEIYLVLCLFVTVLISSIYFYKAERLDTVLYGRYSEFTIAPIMILGFVLLKNMIFNKKHVILK